jgi:hypothetical protein
MRLYYLDFETFTKFHCCCFQKSKQEISDKRIEGSLAFVVLKKINRLDKVRIRGGREALVN